MFERSVNLARFTAGSDISSVEGRIKQLESMIGAMEAHRLKGTQLKFPAVDQPVLMEKPSFQKYLGGTAPPPKVQPMSAGIKEQASAFQPLVEKYATQYGIDPNLVNAVIRQESAFNPNAVSSAGARGLMQLMPATARGLGVTNAFDPEENIHAGVKHLSGLMAKYNGNIALSLAAYNAGGGNVDRHHGIPPFKETQNYVRKILAAYLTQRSNPA